MSPRVHCHACGEVHPNDESENTHLSRERDVAVNALKQIIGEFDDVDQDPVLHLARAALRQIAEPWTRADQSVRPPWPF